VWTILILAFLLVTAAFTPDLEHPVVVLVLESLTWLFWLAAWTAAANPLTVGHEHGFYSTIVALTVFGSIQW
jgi:hypothetical protein